jgi:hypothetical protein
MALFGILYARNTKIHVLEFQSDFHMQEMVFLFFLFLVVQVDNVISQAQATLGALVFQRSTFSGINSKLSNVSSRLPTV